jgi:carbon-monoxide dehydrogenase medium subunit
MLIDINALPDLGGIHVDASGVRIGALARHADVLASTEAAASQPLLQRALSHVAHPTIRNRGTTVGSLVHADAAAEMPAVLRLLEGSVDVASVRGRRTIPAAELFLGPLESTLAHDEIAVEAFFPALSPNGGIAFEEIARRHGDYAVAGVAALVECDGDEVTSARLGFVSVTDVPTVVDVSDHLDDAATAALAEVEPAEDIHASADYRAHLVSVLTTRVLAAAIDHARSRAGRVRTP